MIASFQSRIAGLFLLLLAILVSGCTYLPDPPRAAGVEAPATATLSETSWTLLQYGPVDAPIQPLDQTTISAQFTTDQIRGAAGCNNYFAGYTVNGTGNFQTGPAGSTMMACEPAVMDQEMRFLTALGSAQSLRVEGDRLIIGYPDGELLFGSSSISDTNTLFSQSALGNAVYLTEFVPEGQVKLVDGLFQQPAAPGSASMISVQTLPFSAVGDLDNDGQPEAVVALASSGGGSGTFIELALLEEKDQVVVNTAKILLGDRVQLNSLSLDGSTILVDMVQAGPNDPMCCPSQHVINQYVVTDGGLVLAESTEVEG